MAKKGAWRSPPVAIRVISRQRLLILQEGRCAYCGKLISGEATLDHVWPRSGKWPISDDDNTVLACQSCNREKGDTDPRIFVERCSEDAPIFRLHPELRQN